jgi:hypothetical protein
VCASRGLSAHESWSECDEAPGAGGTGGFGEIVRQADAVSSTSRLRVRFGSTGMPGPMVVEIVTFFR